jgi:hypothetical protein
MMVLETNEASAKDHPARLYTSAEVRDSVGTMRELFLMGAREELDCLMKTGTFVPVREDEVAGYKAKGFAIIPRRLVWQLKKLEAQTVRGKLRITGAGNHFHNHSSGVGSEVFCSNAGGDALRIATAYAAAHGYGVATSDIQTAFLLAELYDERVLVTVPAVLHNLGLVPLEVKCWRVDRALYGLKTSPRRWAEKRDRELANMVFTNEQGVVIRLVQTEDESLWALMSDDGACHGCLVIYVDDFAYISTDYNRDALRTVIRGTFPTGSERDAPAGSGKSLEFLGHEITMTKEGDVMLTQMTFIDSLVTRMALQGCKKMMTPCPENLTWEPEENASSSMIHFAQELAGSLQWLSCHTRPDITFTTSQMASMLTKCPQQAIDLGIRCVKYLASTRRLALVYRQLAEADYEENQRISFYDELRQRRGYPLYSPKTDHVVIRSFGDASFAPQIRGVEDAVARSITGSIVTWAGGPVAWSSKRQSIATSSTAESETIAQLTAVHLGLGARDVIRELKEKVVLRTYNDNVASMHIIAGRNPTLKSRHLVIKAAVIRDLMLTSEADGDFIAGSLQQADLLTKPLAKAKHQEAINMLGMRDAPLADLAEKLNKGQERVIATQERDPATAEGNVSELHFEAVKLLSQTLASLFHSYQCPHPASLHPSISATPTIVVCPPCPPCDPAPSSSSIAMTSIDEDMTNVTKLVDETFEKSKSEKIKLFLTALISSTVSAAATLLCSKRAPKKVHFENDQNVPSRRTVMTMSPCRYDTSARRFEYGFSDVRVVNSHNDNDVARRSDCNAKRRDGHDDRKNG